MIAVRRILMKLLIIILSLGVWLLVLPWLPGLSGSESLLAYLLHEDGGTLSRYGYLMRLPQHPPSLLALLSPWLLMVIILLSRFRSAPSTANQEAAGQRGKLEEINQIIERGEDINAQTLGGQSLLHAAVQEGDESMVGLLLDKGANFDVVEQTTGLSPLHTAVMTGNPAIVEMLIRYGADINAVTGSGATPLHLAATQDNLALIDVLMRYRPEVDCVNADGLTALQLAERGGYRRVASRIAHCLHQQWPYLKHSQH